mmetsp:Transcript_9627/g.35688  ORF Transcript_9627/g.35688 Transcript_9627/m.35688 type:complete len:386 (+) Transcript_9627:1198-2355(+)
MVQSHQFKVVVSLEGHLEHLAEILTALENGESLFGLVDIGHGTASVVSNVHRVNHNVNNLKVFCQPGSWGEHGTLNGTSTSNTLQHIGGGHDLLLENIGENTSDCRHVGGTSQHFHRGNVCRTQSRIFKSLLDWNLKSCLESRSHLVKSISLNLEGHISIVHDALNKSFCHSVGRENLFDLLRGRVQSVGCLLVGSYIEVLGSQNFVSKVFKENSSEISSSEEFVECSGDDFDFGLCDGHNGDNGVGVTHINKCHIDWLLVFLWEILLVESVFDCSSSGGRNDFEQCDASNASSRCECSVLCINVVGWHRDDGIHSLQSSLLFCNLLQAIQQHAHNLHRIEDALLSQIVHMEQKLVIVRFGILACESVQIVLGNLRVSQSEKTCY